MKLNCHSGDLAMVIHDEPICAPNIGRIVRIKGPLLHNRYYGRPCWLVYPVSTDPYYVLCGEGVARGRVITSRDRIDHPDAWLMPIRPEDKHLVSKSLAIQVMLGVACLPTVAEPAPAALAQEASLHQELLRPEAHLLRRDDFNCASRSFREDSRCS